MLPVWAVVVSVCAALSLAGAVHAQPAIPLFDAELDPWTTGDGAGGDNFGRTVVQDGDWLAVGAPGDVLPDPNSITGASLGSVYLYARDGGGWSLAQTLRVPDAVNGATFGLSLAMAGDLLIVAAPRSNVLGPNDAGTVYSFRRDGGGVWQFESRLDSAEPVGDGNFGHALLLLSATELLISAPGEADRGELGAGAVYRFTYDGASWQQQSRMVAESAEAGARFGWAMTRWGSDLLVGVAFAGADNAGAVDRLSLPTGTPIDRLSSPFAAQGNFGFALHASASLLAVGAPSANVTAIDGAGAVALYRDPALALPPELLNAQMVEAQARFGEALWVDATRLLVGAPQADVAPGFDEGMVEYFDVSGVAALFQGALSNPFPGLSGRLGKAIAVDGSGDLLIGADLDRVGPNNAQGSLSLFRVAGQGYAAPERITRGDGAYLERFGSSVSVDRQWAAVGSFLERTVDGGAEAGAVYLYRRVGGQWLRHQRLQSPQPAVEQRFGISLSLVGQRLLVGAYWDASLGTIDAGAAYLFELVGDTWQPTQSLYPPKPQAEGNFGFAVALNRSDNSLVVGEPGANSPAANQGAGHVFRRQGGIWSLVATLQSDQTEPNANYGSAVAMDGDRVLLGGPGATINGINQAGAVTHFRASPNWQLAERLTAPQPSEAALFGQAVAVQGDRIAISASQETVGSQPVAGAIYTRDAAGLFRRLVAVDALAGDRLGSQLAMCGSRLLAGAPGVDNNGESSQGAAYVWADRAGLWQPLPRFLTPDGGALEGLGLAVACDGEIGFAGAPFKAVINPQEGRAYSVIIGNLFADQFESP